MSYTSVMTTPIVVGPSLAEFNGQHNFIEPQAYIYGLHDPRTGELRYIGKSVRPLERLGNHINEHSNTHRGHWLDELSSLGLRPILTILDSVAASADWQAIERVHIATARKDGHRLTNGTDGGDGVTGLCGESHAKMAATWVGRKHTPETRALMRANRALRPPHSVARREHMRTVMRGRQFSPEHINRIRSGVQKLTNDQVREIRRRLSAGESQYFIANLYGIHQGSVSNIFRGKTYGSVR